MISKIFTCPTYPLSDVVWGEVFIINTLTGVTIDSLSDDKVDVIIGGVVSDVGVEVLTDVKEAILVDTTTAFSFVTSEP